MKYTSTVYDSVKDYYFENFNETLTNYDIDKMDRGDVLSAFLTWEGIIGYDFLIKKIMGYYDCKYVEQMED